MSMLTDVLDFVQDTAEEHFGEAEDATYTTDSGSVLVPVVLGQTRIDAIDETMVTVTAEAIDVLIRRSDLVLGGDYIIPTPGHTITLDNGRVLEVRELEGSGQCYRPSDPTLHRLRIHTKIIEDVDPSGS